MTLHVNTAHLEYLTPEREDVCFLEDKLEDMDSIWQLEKGAREGLTNGVDHSPTDPPPRPPPLGFHSVASTTSSSSCSSSSGVTSNVKGNMDSPMSTSTDSPVHLPRVQHEQQSGGAIQKRPRNNLTSAGGSSVMDSPSKSSLTLNVKPAYNNQPTHLRAPLASFTYFNNSTSTATSNSASRTASTVSKLTCPLCNHQEEDPRKLEEHVNWALFDPASPAASATTSTASTRAPASSSNANHDNITPLSLPCPLCDAHYATSLELERHVNRDHSDILSPMVTKRRPSLRDLVPTSPTPSSASSSSSVKPMTTASSIAGEAAS